MNRRGGYITFINSGSIDNESVALAMSYSRSALAGVFAGLLSGVVIGLLYVILLFGFVAELVVELAKLISSAYGVPYETVYTQISGTLSIANIIAPLVYPLQYALIEAVFGLLQHYLMVRLRIKLITSILLTGTMFTLLLGFIPLIAIRYFGGYLLAVVVEKMSPSIYLYSSLPGFLYTLFLIVVHHVRGPWSRALKAKPSTY